MIPLLVFYGNVVAAAALFTKHWQEGDLKHGILAVTYLALIFSVGWSMSTFLVKLVTGEKGFAVWLDRDALSLLLLAVVESAFFAAQLRQKGSRNL